ncbi:MAG: hypothetical protein PVI44_03200 [Balneolaceae bacterium]
MGKILINLGLGVMLLFVSSVPVVQAQQRAGKGKKAQLYNREYNLQTVETVEGEVIEVVSNPSEKNAEMIGTHVIMKTDSETVSVHLGPVWYMEQQESLNEGDRIVVTGSRISYKGAPAIIAAVVRKNEMTLQLRDRNGFPVWRGWRMGKNVNR